MRIEIQGSGGNPLEIGVRFQYSEDGITTTCMIEEKVKDKWVGVFRAESRRHPNDKPNRRMGRKVAFEKAVRGYVSFIREGMLSANDGARALRTKFWEAFLSTTKLPGQKKVLS